MKLHFQQDDIWTRRERTGRTSVWVSQEFLVSNTTLTEYILRVKYRYEYMQTVKHKRRREQDILPDTGADWRFARKQNTFYYDYDRLPASRKDLLPKKDELLSLYEASIKSLVVDDLEAAMLEDIKDLALYKPAYTDCTEIQARHLARACVVLRFAAKEIMVSEPTSSNELYRHLAAIIKRHNWPYLPKNYRRLKEKIDQVVDGVDPTTIIQLPRTGNKNAVKYQDKQLIAWLLYLRSRPENYSNAHIARRVRRMCQLSNKPCPSKSWIEQFFANPRNKFLTGAKRHRGGRKGADYRDYLHIQGAIYAGDCWQMDGTRVNFLPHLTKDGSEKSMMIIAVRDVHSGDIVGYHLDTKEDRYGYLHALNMAVQETGHLPYELVHDRFPGHNTDEWKLLTRRMEREGCKVTITSTATGKSHVERCFGTLQDVFMQDSPWYYGQGIQSSREAAHRSPDYLVAAKKRARREGFDFDAAWRAASQVVHAYRNTPLSEYSTKHASVHECPRHIYNKSEQPNIRVIDDFRRVELFGTCRSATIRNNGLIRMRIHQAEYVYRIDDYDIIANYKKVTLYYDLEDLSSVHLFAPGDDINAAYLGEAMEEEAIQMYGPKKDYEKLAKAKQARAQVREQRDQELEELVNDAGPEVDLLLAAVTNKTTVDDAQSRWLEERVGIWQDKGAERRMPAPEPDNEPESLDVDPDDLARYVARRNY